MFDLIEENESIGEIFKNFNLDRVLIMGVDEDYIFPFDCLEELFEERQVTFPLKRILAGKLGQIARKLHVNGINHRDFYLCHFLYEVDSLDPSLYLIDLHRAQLRNRTPLRLSLIHI